MHAHQPNTQSTWLGTVPAHWNVKALKFCADLIADRTNGSESAARYVGLEHIESKTGRFVATSDGMQHSADSTVNRFCVRDVLFGKLRPYLAKAAVADTDGVCTSEILVYRPHSLEPAYLRHVMLLDRFISEVNGSTFGSKMPRADASFISRLNVPQPPANEQIAIAAYLDAETARIGALIGEKKRLLIALEELKNTRISELLTGGRSATVPTGDTWLPRIPDGWSLMKLKRLGEVRSGVAKGKKHETGVRTVELPYMRVANVQDGFIDLADVAVIEVAERDVDRYTLHRGDVLMNEGGDYDKLGRGAVWEGLVDGCLHQNHVFAVRLEDVKWAPWLAGITRTSYAKFYFMNNSKQSTNLASINQTNVKEFPVAMPPPQMRDELLKSLSKELDRISDLSKHVVLELKLLEELRSSTITDAVLGQIRIPTKITAKANV